MVAEIWASVMSSFVDQLVALIEEYRAEPPITSLTGLFLVVCAFVAISSHCVQQKSVFPMCRVL